MASLFQPLAIKSITLKNRIVVSPMCQYSATDGFANDWHLVHLGCRAVGGAGLILTEATAVVPEGRITPGDIGIWRDGHIDGLKRIVDFIHTQGTVAGIQLAHAGRKSSCAVPWEGGKQLNERLGGWQTVAPSNIPFNAEDRIPQSLDEEGIRTIVLRFKEAAERALQAGFKVAEIHSAHGYLLFEFLSPLTNQRKDQYGGSFQNRTRLLLQVTGEVRSVWPDENPLFVRVSSTDWSEGGWTLEETVKLAVLLKEHGVDLIDCSSGGNLPQAQIPFSPGYQVQFSDAVRKTGILTGAVGFITSALQAEAILQENKADLVLFGREMLRNPYFALQAARDLGAETSWPVQYLRAKPAN
jgi:2,4-dienoyl-CoA reductase-like NADH-dependent reductase (Old Yellow Enzyme family)